MTEDTKDKMPLSFILMMMSTELMVIADCMEDQGWPKTAERLRSFSGEMEEGIALIEEDEAKGR